MKILLTAISLLASLPAAISRTPNPSHCRCTPDDSCWPSPDQWTHLNTSINGNLAAVRPIAHVCHSPDLDKDACKFVQESSVNSTWRLSQPGAVQWTNWEAWPARNESCFVDTGSRIPCGQGRVSMYSAAVERASEIEKAVQFAREHDLRLAVKASGHDFLGRSVAPHSLQITTHRLKEVRFTKDFFPRGCRKASSGDEAKKCGEGPAVTAQSGVTLQELYDKVFERELTVVAGLSHTVVAAGGYIQGGGHSPLGTWKGMASDNALEFEVVTADGKLVVANEYQNPDLFWALRGGGGGTFGVVVSVTMRTYPEPPIVLRSIIVTTSIEHTDDYWTAVEEFHRHLPSINDGGASGYYYLFPMKPNNNTAELKGAFFFANQTETDIPTIDSLFEPVVSALNDIPNLNVSSASLPFPQMRYLVAEFLPSDSDITGSTSAIGSRLVSRDFLLSPDGPKKLTDTLSQLKLVPGRSIIGHVVAGGTVASNADKIDSALNPAWRRTISHIVAGATWPSNTPPEEVAGIHSRITGVEGTLLRDLEPNMGAYPNEADAYEPEFQRSFWGENYERLRAVKECWDPEDLFVVRSGVGSEDWDEEGLCRK